MSSIYRHKLAIWSVCVAIVFIVFWELDREIQGPLDPYIVLSIGAVKQIIVLMMVLLTRQWTWRAIGVMSVMQGVATMYLGSAILYWNPAIRPTFAEPASDLARSFFIVGIVPLFIGVCSYAWVVTSTGIKRRGANITGEGDAWEIPSWIDERDRRQTRREYDRNQRQDEREDGLDTRAAGLDKRGWDMSKESIRQEHRNRSIEDREDALERREKE